MAKDLGNVSLRVLKEKVADVIELQLRPIRERYAEVMADRKALDKAAQKGAREAGISANATLLKVKKAVGLA